MEFDLTPKMAQTYFEGEAGVYYHWSSAEFPLLPEAKVGAGKLVIHPLGFVLPHFTDCSKVGYVLQGTNGIVGMILPNTSQEKLLTLKKGDIIFVPKGGISWWYNNGNSDFIIVFLGETQKAYNQGEFTYTLLSGAQGILNGFSLNFISKAYNINEINAKKLVTSQIEVLMVMLEKGNSIPIPIPKEESDSTLVCNIDVRMPEISVTKGGEIISLRESKFPILGQLGLSVNVVKLDGNAICAPMYTSDSSVQVIYVAKGGGRVEIVDITGRLVLDCEISVGELFVVPKFYAVGRIAGADGMECFSVITNPMAVLEELGGDKSVFQALSPGVLQASLNVDSEFVEFFKTKVNLSTIIIPPKN